MDWVTPASLLLSAGGGAILLELVKRILDALSNKGKSRRDEVDKAWTMADKEAALRRRWQEHGSHLRRLLISAECVDTESIPSPPGSEV